MKEEESPIRESPNWVKILENEPCPGFLPLFWNHPAPAECLIPFLAFQRSEARSQQGPSFSVVVAIDFGTTSSGYAFSFTSDPEAIHMMR